MDEEEEEIKTEKIDENKIIESNPTNNEQANIEKNEIIEIKKEDEEPQIKINEENS